MRIAIISAPAHPAGAAAKQTPPEYIKYLAKGMGSMGHHVDIIDAWTNDGMMLPSYEYIAVVAEPVSFFSGKITDKIYKILAACSSVAGKKSAAFVKKSGLFTNRALDGLMRVMEKEGMIINWSDVLINPEHCEALGKRIGT